MKKVILFSVLALLLLFGSTFVFKLSERNAYKSRGEALILKVETYKKKNDSLPETIKDIDQSNVEMEEGPYYDKISDTDYRIYFNIGFDKQLVYSSKTRKWEDKL
ncbi:hypothetical protein [Muricauda sp. MAR_2010_75]|jgi:hypothetical protein|uniref:hypothetical protein n=1 Tax=Allomuricauda sp. MAR_2010_75 TaxID=1250232 RepID=UPI000568133B|nr:hypothetical protein [Muricauda sp. MAR_2010_75]